MPGNVLDMTLACWVQSGTESTGPVLAFAQELDHLLGVGTSGAAVALLMMLVERVGTPEATVAARFRTWVLSPSLMELVFVSLPIVLALEARFA